MIRFLLFVLIAGLVGYYVGVTKIAIDWQKYNPHVLVTSKEPPADLTNVDMTQFWNVMEKVNSTYYDKSKVNPQNMVNGAISGMVASLNDPYTLYLPPQSNSNFKQQMSGQFEGIGAELGLQGKQIVVVEPLGGMPAAQAGIRPADMILKVDNVPTEGLTLEQVIDKVRGPKGTKVTLNVLHKDEDKPVDITIARNTITVKSVTSWTKQVKDVPNIETTAMKNALDAEVAYIRLSQFGDNTNQEWVGIASAIALEKQKNPKFKGVILDLRNNPGGYLTDAQFVASEFISDGVIVIQDDGKGNQVPLTVNRKGLLTDATVVVLINKGSASASEIVSGALRDHNRAKLIGDTSFGKGTIQQAEDLGRSRNSYHDRQMVNTKWYLGTR